MRENLFLYQLCIPFQSVSLNNSGKENNKLKIKMLFGVNEIVS